MRPLPLEIDPFLIASVQGNSAHSEEKGVIFHPLPEFSLFMMFIINHPAPAPIMALGVGPN